ncbi:MAG TPA: FtsX-like permease family protein, partial [Acidimicrobiales bacterium]|nr:FtsX-like permease family protein [Acidimicrobiales bacterium]
LGLGALATRSALRQYGPPVARGITFVDVQDGVDPEAFAEDLTRTLAESMGEADPVIADGEPQRPADIVGLARVRSGPLILAGILAALILAQVVVALLGARRGRRRELAVLTTLGFLRRQVAATITWQTVTVAVASLLVGVPLGIALGRWAWTSLADRIGAVPEAVTPWVLLGALALGVLASAALLSFLTGAWLARRRPGAELRAE